MNTGYTLAKPFHPGGFVRRKILEPRNLTIMGAAATLGVTRQGLSDFLAERASLTVEIAFEIEKAFGFNAEALMEMQTRFDLTLLRQRQRAAQMQMVAKQNAQPSKSGRRSAA
ncbi:MULTISPECIES: HigA family addiction module antitoxin [unclassified Methylobacterium]|uniref:HigA family addiction module antitoxin n=1 Tax=unclassified Methylobacterium TaxID=2615210 RepID=UPI001FB9FDB3|nr:MULTISPECIES: HigA family addiction module antitoxin [unclassified Methylobacterium]MCJ2016535.1 HigA family addiction module antitoxin [Methylobacterium sp. E-065]